MNAGQQQGPSAMSSETVTIMVCRDTDFKRTICGLDTMSGGWVKSCSTKPDDPFYLSMIWESSKEHRACFSGSVGQNAAKVIKMLCKIKYSFM